MRQLAAMHVRFRGLACVSIRSMAARRQLLDDSRSGRVPGVLVVLMAALLSVPATASASCVGPQLSYGGGQVRPGDTVPVVGQYWGDDCYDTGSPPEGEGGLGLPRRGIVVVFQQGSTQTVVARGNADADYEFQVDVMIPETAVAGEARLAAWAGDEEEFAAAGEPLVVDSAGEGSLVRVASFGPTDSAVTRPAPTTSRWPVLILVAVLIGGGAVLGRRWRHRSRSR